MKKIIITTLFLCVMHVYAQENKAVLYKIVKQKANTITVKVFDKQHRAVLDLMSTEQINAKYLQVKGIKKIYLPQQNDTEIQVELDADNYRNLLHMYFNVLTD